MATSNYPNPEPKPGFTPVDLNECVPKCGCLCREDDETVIYNIEKPCHVEDSFDLENCKCPWRPDGVNFYMRYALSDKCAGIPPFSCCCGKFAVTYFPYECGLAFGGYGYDLSNPRLPCCEREPNNCKPGKIQTIEIKSPYTIVSWEPPYSYGKAAPPPVDATCPPASVGRQSYNELLGTDVDLIVIPEPVFPFYRTYDARASNCTENGPGSCCREVLDIYGNCKPGYEESFTVCRAGNGVRNTIGTTETAILVAETAEGPRLAFVAFGILGGIQKRFSECKGFMGAAITTVSTENANQGGPKIWVKGDQESITRWNNGIPDDEDCDIVECPFPMVGKQCNQGCYTKGCKREFCWEGFITDENRDQLCWIGDWDVEYCPPCYI